MQSVIDLLTLKPGQRLACPACDTELIVVRSPSRAVRLACGGVGLGAIGVERPKGGHPDADGAAAQLGKLYMDEESGLELLCTKPGDGALSCNGKPIGMKGAKPLPASD
jgi:hypothetical protein